MIFCLMLDRVKPAILRQATYGTLKLGFYQIIKKKLARRPGEQSLFNNIISGMISGATAMSMLDFKIIITSL